MDAGQTGRPPAVMWISTDPEQDTPVRLREYARKFRPGPEWQHYTGTIEASLAAQRALDVYRGDKMSHAPVTVLRAAPGRPWVHIDGFTGSCAAGAPNDAAFADSDDYCAWQFVYEPRLRRRVGAPGTVTL